MSLLRGLVVTLALAAPAASAQTCPVVVDGRCAGPDGTPYATAAQLPQPADVVGPAEAVGGAPGSAITYKRGDWMPPRISRTGYCALATGNSCTIAWTTPFPAGVTPVMLGEPVAVNAAAQQPIDCDVVAPPSITGVAVKCWAAQATTLSLSLVTSGVSVAPYSAATLAGVTVTAAAIPASS